MGSKTPAANGGTTDPAVITAVLREIEKERITAHRRLDELGAAMMAEDRKWFERIEPLRKAFEEAEAAARTHEARYKSRLPLRQYDQEHRTLEAAKAEAKEKHEAALAEGRKAVTLLQKPHGEHQRKAEDLRKEWDANARWARAAGVDLAAFWEPGQPLPPMEE